MRGAARPGMMQAIEMAHTPPPPPAAPRRSRARSSVENVNTSTRVVAPASADRHLQRGPCVGAHRAAAVDEQHDSWRPPRAAQPSRRQRLAAGLQAGPQRAPKVEASSPDSPAASGATGRGAAGERTIARHRATRGRRAATRARRTRRRRAGCSSIGATTAASSGPSPVDSSGVERAATRLERFVRVGVRWERLARAPRRRLRGRRRRSPAPGAWRAPDPAEAPAGPGRKNCVNAASKTVTSSSVPARMGRSAWRTARSLARSTTSSARAASLQLAGPDAEAMLAAQRVAECGEILRQAGEGVHQRRGADTEPNPKSVSRLYPPARGRRARHPEWGRAPRDARA